jgi:hypothetical protein
VGVAGRAQADRARRELQRPGVRPSRGGVSMAVLDTFKPHRARRRRHRWQSRTGQGVRDRAGGGRRRGGDPRQGRRHHRGRAGRARGPGDNRQGVRGGRRQQGRRGPGARRDPV